MPASDYLLLDYFPSKHIADIIWVVLMGERRKTRPFYLDHNRRI